MIFGKRWATYISLCSMKTKKHKRGSLLKYELEVSYSIGHAGFPPSKASKAFQLDFCRNSSMKWGQIATWNPFRNWPTLPHNYLFYMVFLLVATTWNYVLLIIMLSLKVLASCCFLHVLGMRIGKPCARFSRLWLVGKGENTSWNGSIHCTRTKTLVDNVERSQVQIRNFSNFSNFSWTSWNKRKHQPENVWELWTRKSFSGLGDTNYLPLPTRCSVQAIQLPISRDDECLIAMPDFDWFALDSGKYQLVKSWSL